MNRHEREAALSQEIHEHARRIAAEAPPLTPEQVDKLRALLGPGAAWGQSGPLTGRERIEAAMEES